MPRAGCRRCVILGFDGARGLGGGADFLGDLFGLFGIEIHRNLNAGPFDKQAHHTMIGRADLKIRFDIAFGVDAHLRLRELCPGATAQRVENQADYAVI